MRNEEDAAALKQEVSGALKTILFDVAEPSQIVSARDKVASDLNGASRTGLVNNAGIPLGGPLEFLSMLGFRYELDVNLIGAVAVTQAFMPLIR